MPAGFTAQEKEKIEKGMVEEGRKLFGLYGLQKTTIKDITKAVGIAQGSFYKFYDSKEELYFEILDIEGQKMRQELEKDLEMIEREPATGLKKLLQDTYQMLDQNSLYRDLFSGNSYDILVRKLPKEKIEEHIATDFAVVEPFIRKLQDKGIIKQVKTEAIAGLLHALFFVTLHKNDIGEQAYRDTFELLVDLIVDGLVKG